MNISERDLKVIENHINGRSNRENARLVLGSDTKESTVRGILSRYGDNLTEVVAAHYAGLSRRVQKQSDQLRVERKHTRETNRVYNVLEELGKEIENTFKLHDMSKLTKSHKVVNKTTGVLQLSDLHFGERVDDGLNNVYDLRVIAARLKKFVDKAKTYFMAHGVESIVIAMTGDLINSDRRLDEITVNSKNRSEILFNAVDILQQLILDLNEDFVVNIASICGNESRVGKDVGWSSFTASDSYDYMIHEILSRMFKDAKGVHFIPMSDPLECVIEVNGSNLLMIHGHNGLANTAKMENEVNKTKARYASRGIKIDYVIAGHIHQSYVSDNFARSSGLVGGNAYAEKALNLHGKAAQNIYIFEDDGTIDGIKIDLENYSLKNSYNFDPETEAYKPVERKGTVVIQSVTI